MKYTQARTKEDRTVRRGFSLIELVVVVIVAALLIAIVQPTLATARRQSKFALCLDRLAGIGAATAIYSAEDPNGLALPVHPLFSEQDPTNPTFIGAYEWGGKSGIGSPGWIPGASGPEFFLTSRYGTKAGYGPATRPLNRILYPHGFRDHLNPRFDPRGAIPDTQLQLDAYKCPADDGAPLGAHCPDWIDNPGRSSFDHFGTSYSANVFLTSYWGGGPIVSNSPFLRPLSRVPAPARTLAYDENIGRWAWASRRNKDDCRALLGYDGFDPGPTKAIPGWHGRNWTFNRAFVDGHVATQPVFIEGTGDADGFFEHYRTELVFPDDEFQQMQSVCIIVRGEGWQVDTLPASPIPTGLYLTQQVPLDGCVSIP